MHFFSIASLLYSLPPPLSLPLLGVQLIRDLAEQIDYLTPQVVKAAVDVKREPTNRDVRQRLDTLRKEWAGKVQQLTGAIDDIIDPEDFMAVSGECWGIEKQSVHATLVCILISYASISELSVGTTSC